MPDRSPSPFEQTSLRRRQETLKVPRRPNTRAIIVGLFLDGRERSSRQVASEFGFGEEVTNTTILPAWQKGELLRSKDVIFEKN